MQAGGIFFTDGHKKKSLVEALLSGSFGCSSLAKFALANGNGG